MKKQFIKFSIFVLAATSIFTPLALPSKTAYASREDIISDGVFGNENAMSESQIDNFINAFPNSCLKPTNYPAGLSPVTWKEPLGYSAYGGDVSPARIIWKSAQLYHINPQVILATLEKEQGIVTGNSTYGCTSRLTYNSAMGYNCPDGSENARKSYPNIGIGDDQKTCVQKESNVTFSRQVNRAAWQLSFDAHRANGDLAWMGDGAIQYYGRMTQGNRARVQGGSVQYYDGTTIIDGVSIQLANGPTAALYNYTPHFNSFETIFTKWFGTTHTVSIPGCDIATNTSLSCVWKARKADGSEVITPTHGDINYYVNNLGYGYGGFSFVVRNASSPSQGNIPIYNLIKASGATFLTADYNEYSALSAPNSGFTPNGIAFFADPANSNSGWPVYRMYNPQTYQHVWTTSPGDYATDYNVEQVAFTSINSVRQETAPPSGQKLVYRFRDMPSNAHFWTTDLYERDSMIGAGYSYDGVGWRSLKENGTPIYRLYAEALKQHLYTTDYSEVQNLSTNHGWRYEGVSMYAASSGSPVYRLYRPQTGEHFYTTDAYERQVLITNKVFLDEGVAWYQP